MDESAADPGVLPPPVRAAVERLAGAPFALQALGGLGGAQVWRAGGAAGSAIVKAGDRPGESGFYQATAPLLRQGGVPIPELRFAWRDARWWLVLEDIPLPLPPERWLADPEQLAVLRRLHRLPPELAPGDGYRPAWPAALTEAAADWLGAETGLRRALERLAEEAQPLFAPVRLISGDPNPRNWGRRADGTLALFDWERLSRADPAIDLAITVPGLGARQDFAAVARQYGAGAAELEPLARRIAVAKAWTIVELIGELSAGNVDSEPLSAFLRERGPRFLLDIGAETSPVAE